MRLPCEVVHFLNQWQSHLSPTYFLYRKRQERPKGRFAAILIELTQKKLQVALVGNPNSGKTSLFNALTGLNQQVGNFPGVTVDRKTGKSLLEDGTEIDIIDLPGAYSLYPKRGDEWVTYKVLMGIGSERPDVAILVADASNLKRNLLFCSQILDLKLPIIIALTMNDIAEKKGIKIDISGLESELGVSIVPVNPRKSKGIGDLKKTLSHQQLQNWNGNKRKDFIELQQLAPEAIKRVQSELPGSSNYAALHYLINHESFPLNPAQQAAIEQIEKDTAFNPTKVQAEEILARYKHINKTMQQTTVVHGPLERKLMTEKLDNIFLHRHWGYAILIGVLFLLFQSVFWVAQYPMDMIETLFQEFSSFLAVRLPLCWWSDLLINGVVAGMGGIMVFVPQIMILFGLITLLEDTGYMARISFLTDKLMRKVGLNGKSVMPLISGYACAVPAIMSARSIENRKERLLTILVTPLMSCSARLPVYTILVSLVFNNTFYLGIISLRGLVMMGLYLFGTLLALLLSLLGKSLVKIHEKSFFILELPSYRSPRWKNAGMTMLEKAEIFVKEAGRVIMVISLCLWALCSTGPNHRMEALKKNYEESVRISPDKKELLAKTFASEKLKASYAGIMGKALEPLIRPLGFDWKIGVALITSFAAREVFVSTMATLYSVEQEDNNASLRQKMKAAKYLDGTPVYTLPTAMSLMVFYLIAMQCMSTFAVVRRETKSWFWPIGQLVVFTVLAYSMSLVTYQGLIAYQHW